MKETLTAHWFSITLKRYKKRVIMAKLTHFNIILSSGKHLLKRKRILLNKKQFNFISCNMLKKIKLTNNKMNPNKKRDLNQKVLKKLLQTHIFVSESLFYKMNKLAEEIWKNWMRRLIWCGIRWVWWNCNRMCSWP